MKKVLVLAVSLAALVSVVLPVTALAVPPDPLQMGPYGVNRTYYDAGTLQLTVPSSGVLPPGSGTCETGSGSTHEYGSSSKCPGQTFPQPLEGSITWPKSHPGPYKVILFLHGRHSACKGTTGTDNGGQSFLTGLCPNPNVPVNPAGPSGPETVEDAGSVTGFWPSWGGYNYISDLLASWGYVVISPSAGALVAFDGTSVMDAGAFARAEIIGNTLDILYSLNEGVPGPAPTSIQQANGQPGIGTQLAGKLDFSKVGIMGHSRGGEGVTEFIPFNRARPAPGRRYNLQAVFSLAPIDRNKQMPYGTNYATLLPACDGDVTTIAGANAFERGKYVAPDDPYAKIQYYVEGANHNFYNTRWPSSDRGGSDIACGTAFGTGKARLTPEDQRKTGLATMPTFLRAYIGGETDLMPWLTGEAGLPASACATGPTHVPFCEDQVKQTYIAPAGERLDILRPGPGVRPTTASPIAPNEVGGMYSGTGFSTFQWCNPDPFANVMANPPATQTTTALVACEGPDRVLGTPPSTTTYTANQAIQSWGPQLTLAWNGPATLTTTLRGDARNATPYDNLVFRAAFQSNDEALNPVGNYFDPRSATQDFWVVVTDREGQESAHKLTEFFSGGVEKALGTTPNNSQHVVLNQFIAPLATFAADGVDVAALDRIEFRFGTAGVNPSGAIQFSDVAFQETPETAATPFAALKPLPSDPELPKLEALKTGAPRFATEPGYCVDKKKPTLTIKAVKSGKKLVVTGKAGDKGCAAGAAKKASPGTVEQVQVSVFKEAGKKCRFLGADGRLMKKTPCTTPLSVVASGKKHWKLRPPKRLPAGKYKVAAFAIDGAGNVSSVKFSRIEVGS
ncbi:MAG TPA: hypothetical protein VFB52_01410 [Solirubrobacterales bacterium]|nr:hypothetical protein [Solirubrobacterales bacterium]